MSISTRITSIQEHIGDIYDTLELGGVDLTNVDKNLINISPKLRQKYLDYMNNGTQEIWNNWEKVTGTGSNVKLNNTVQAPMDLDIGGNSEQVQYSGKNLVYNTLLPKTIAGVTITYDASRDVYKLTGTATNNANGYIITYSVPIASLNANESIEIYIERVSGIKKVQFLCYFVPDDESATDYSYYAILNENQTGIVRNVKTPTKSGKVMNVQFYIASGTTYNDEVRIMVSKTLNADYEPYVGGTASPNPSYPQEITNVTGDVEVLVQNKNLFTGDFSQFNNTGGTGTLCGYFKLPDDGNSYTLSAIAKNDFTPSSYNYLGFSKNGGTATGGTTWLIYGNQGTITKGTKLSITAVANRYVSIFSNTLQTFQELIDNFDIQLEQGSTATSYVEHQEQTFTFPLGTQRMYLGDYLADDGIHHVRGEYTLSSSATLQTATIFGVSCKYASYNISTMKSQSSVSGDFYCNKIKYSNGAWAKYQGYIIARNFVVLTDSEDTNENYNSKVGGAVVQYELAEEEITPYTTEQQQAYDEIKQAISYEEQTNISGTSDECNPILTAVALMNF